MINTCLCFFTKDRQELSEQTIRPLLGLNADIMWIDGSATQEGKDFPGKLVVSLPAGHRIIIHPGIRGGPDAAVAYALTTALKGSDYEYIGIVENDVLLHPDWFGPTMALFERGAVDNLAVGAVSARCYEDRILFQRDGYAVMHNLGFGHQILTREAARLTLRHMRTGITTENRRLFCQLSGLDIGKWWAFGASENFLTGDWHNDCILASHGLISLALVPSPVEMIGQSPPLHEQGLKLAQAPVELLRNDKAFKLFVSRMRGPHTTRDWFPGVMPFMHDPTSGASTIFPHQIAALGGIYEGDWRLKWSQGFGPFAWMAGKTENVSGSSQTEVYAQLSTPPYFTPPTVAVPLSGPIEFLVGGGEQGGKVELHDPHSGYNICPDVPANQVITLPVPAGVSYREVRLTMLAPGTIFHGLRTREPQPWLPSVEFDWYKLPKV